MAQYKTVTEVPHSGQTNVYSSFLAVWRIGYGHCLSSASSTVTHRWLMLAGSVSGRLHSKWWWCHDIAYPLLAAEHSPCKAPWSGTLCRMTSAHNRTMSPLDSTWKPHFSLATNVLRALETSWQLRYINSHLPLPLSWL